MEKKIKIIPPEEWPKITQEIVDKYDDAADIALDAFSADSLKQRWKLANKALAISPYCIDAYNILAEDLDSDEEALKMYELGKLAGEKFFGKKFFKENAGIFWDILETRPYMRSLLGLAQSYNSLGRFPDAIATYEQMLHLCEDDNLGVRDILFPLLLKEGEIEKAELLADKYNSDDATWLFGRLLLMLKKGESEEKLKALLKKAIKSNKYAAAYLSLKKKMPKSLPLFYSLGSQEEAIFVAYYQLEAWEATEGACAWLAKELPTRKRANKSVSAKKEE